MRPFPSLLFLSVVAVSIVEEAACVTDSVPPDNASASDTSRTDAGVDAGKPGASRADAGRKHDATAAADRGDDTDDRPADGGDSDVGARPPQDAGTKPPMSGSDGDAGACDLSGPWLITQHTSHEGLGVKQTGLWWYYYELEHSGEDVTVGKGLVCGGRVIPGPDEFLAANVDWEAAWPALVAKNTQHTSRSAKVSMSGSSCAIAFDVAWTVLGAAPVPYYADESHPLPTIDQEVSGDTPGWEDWDDDGKPGVSLIVTGLAPGARYVAERVMNDWNGKFDPGAETFKLQAVANQEESLLGVTSDLLNTPGVVDSDKTAQFVQFAKLSPDQVGGDDATICANVRDLAPMLTPEANQVSK